ncbi:MAG: acyl carrier protein [Helicobacteraceae bacterium]|nr:acyl carrier protein [Helicobacteraceae bacterium]
MTSKVKEIFIKVTGVSEDTIDEGLQRNVVEGWDSFNHLILIMELSNATGIAITSKQSSEIENYGDLLKIFGGR